MNTLPKVLKFKYSRAKALSSDVKLVGKTSIGRGPSMHAALSLSAAGGSRSSLALVFVVADVKARSVGAKAG